MQTVKLFSQSDYSSQQIDDNNEPIPQPFEYLETYRVALYITRRGIKVRTAVELDGCLLNLLIESTGIDKSDISRAVQEMVDDYSPFDAMLPITRQINYLIVKIISQRNKLNRSQGA